MNKEVQEILILRLKINKIWPYLHQNKERKLLDDVEPNQIKQKKKSRIDFLEIHHKDRNPNNNDPRNLRVLTTKEHEELHKRSKKWVSYY